MNSFAVRSLKHIYRKSVNIVVVCVRAVNINIYDEAWCTDSNAHSALNDPPPPQPPFPHPNQVHVIYEYKILITKTR